MLKTSNNCGVYCQGGCEAEQQFAEKPHPNFKCNQHEFVHTNEKGLAMKQEFLKLMGTMTVRKKTLIIQKVYTAVEFKSVKEVRTDLV